MSFIVQGEKEAKYLSVVVALAIIGIAGAGLILCRQYLEYLNKKSVEDIVLQEQQQAQQTQVTEDPSFSIGQEPEEKDCGKELAQSSKDYCYLNTAVTKLDQSICDKIQAEMMKNSCYDSLATAKQDSSICDKLQDQEEKDLCAAKAKRDLSVCDNMQGQ
ncbi:MAG: hypothetical protein WC949_04210 [Candidatus Paceibacterota bacterium]|jgi:hypothetical protein